MSLKFIELTPEHIPQLLKIEQNAHVSPWSKGMFETAFNKRAFSFALTVNDEFETPKTHPLILGYVIAENIVGEVTLHNICVDKVHQGQGYSNMLMQHFIEQANLLNGEEVWLEVRRSNSAAIHLYKKFGFTDQGIRKDYYSIPLSMQNENNETREDALLMCLKLL